MAPPQPATPGQAPSIDGVLRARLTQLSADQSPDPILWVARSAKIVYANDAAGRLFGCTREALAGRDLAGLDPSFPVDAWSEYWAELKARESVTFESEPRMLNGQVLRAEIAANFMACDGHEYVCATIRDITPRKLAEETQRHQLEQLSALSTLADRLSASPALDAMYEATMVGFQRALGVDRMAILLKDPDGVLRFKACRDLSLAYRSAVEGHSFWAADDPHPMPVSVTDVTSDASLEGLRSVLLEEGILAFVAVPLLVESRLLGKCMLYFATPRSLTVGERRLAQTIARHVAFAVERQRSADEIRETTARLRRSEARFRSLIQNSSDITTVLAADGTILYESPAFERLTGWAVADVLGKPCCDFIHPDDVGPVTTALRAAVESPSTTQMLELRFRRPDGTYMVFESAGNSRMDDPDVAGVVVNSRDVTERNRLAGQLRQAQKMEALGRLAGGIAHDFNNLLTVIAGYTAALMESSTLEPETRSYIEEMQRASARATDLTRQLLAFGRRQASNAVTLDLNRAVTDSAALLRRIIGENIQLATHLDVNPSFVNIDQGQLEQVIVNLAINARDAMADGGALLLETRSGAGSQVTLTVRDNGCGMDALTQSRIFEPFFSTKEQAHGTGLGLAIVYGIVAQNGGTIDVQSAVGQGTTIRVTFPTVQPPSAMAAPSMPVDTTTSGRETVLLVEDEEQVRVFVRRILTGRGYRVVEAPDAEAALQAYQACEDRIDLLLTDIVMPGLNGRVLAERLTQVRPDLKVVYMTGYTEDPTFTGTDTPGAFLIRKPFVPESLALVIRRALTGLPRSA